MAWFSGSSKASRHSFSRFWLEKSPPKTLQILAFEAAKVMSRLVALYSFLSDDEFSKLRNGPMKSEGVTYLNSSDEGYLLKLACEEKLEELNSIAITVSRLAQKCSDSSLKHFDHVFADLKQGIIAIERVEYRSSYAEKIIKKMEKCVAATSSLHVALESLAETEVAERKVKLWKLNESQKLPQRTNSDYLEEKLVNLRKQVKNYREISLWSKTFDKSVGLMSQIICILYVRICDVFCPFVLSLPRVFRNNSRQIYSSKSKHMKIHPELDYCLLPQRGFKSGPLDINQERGFNSGPLSMSPRKSRSPKYHSQELAPVNSKRNGISGKTETNRKFAIQLAPPFTVGGAGLALRYANIIILAERYLCSPMNMNDDTRSCIYEMLPTSLKATVRGKLWSRLNRKQGNDVYDCALAEGWRDALEEILKWLAPIAHDTLQWQAERNLEKQRFDAKPTVLLLQTLYFSDLEKTEAAIVDVLVGLSCIYKYENRRLHRGGLGHVDGRRLHRGGLGHVDGGHFPCR